MTHSPQEIWELRGELYSFLGNCLLEPIQGQKAVALSREFWHNFPCDPANEQMESGLEQLINCTTKLEELNTEEAVQKVMVEYTALFLGPGQPKAPPWESVYRTPEQILFGRPTYEVREAIRLHGLEARGKNRQPEDHIGLELIFLSAVSRKLSDSPLDSHTSTIQEQIRFIDEHLLSWISELSKDANTHGSVGYYGGLIELAWGILLWDRELLLEFLESENLA